VDHWFKNAFMVLGILLALFYQPELWAWSSARPLALAVLATCLIASSNYVLNEWLDGPLDALHPVKKHRPVPAGKIRAGFAYAEWLALAAAGFALAYLVNPYFLLCGVWLWVMGIVYNVPPIRSKDVPYVDVLSESVNNPIRLMLGWFALVTTLLPPLSLVLAYWMVGAFFMAIKRYAEYRHIGNKKVAAAYRRSFAHYTEERLLVSLFFYATACAFFAGIFIVRYHVELILFVPVAAGLFAYYFSIGLKPNSPVQNPEKLYKERRFLLYALVSVAVFVILMFTSIPALYDWFNISPSTVSPLWTIG
jgi:4-hydroxybenzoate polyprenyltransferase